MKHKDKPSKYAIYSSLTITDLKNRVSELKSCASHMITFIEAIPDDIASRFPAMPGIDRDWADEVLDKRGIHKLSKTDLRSHVVELQCIIEGLYDYIEAIPAATYDDKSSKEAKDTFDLAYVSMGTGNFSLPVLEAATRY